MQEDYKRPPNYFVEWELTNIIRELGGFIGPRKTWEDTLNSAEVQRIFKGTKQAIGLEKEIRTFKSENAFSKTILCDPLYDISPTNDLKIVEAVKIQPWLKYNFIRYGMIGPYIISIKNTNDQECIEIRQSNHFVNKNTPKSFKRISQASFKGDYLTLTKGKNKYIKSPTTPSNELYYGDKYENSPLLLKIHLDNKGNITANNKNLLNNKDHKTKIPNACLEHVWKFYHYAKQAESRNILAKGLRAFFYESIINKDISLQPQYIWQKNI